MVVWAGLTVFRSIIWYNFLRDSKLGKKIFCLSNNAAGCLLGSRLTSGKFCYNQQHQDLPFNSNKTVSNLAHGVVKVLCGIVLVSFCWFWYSWHVSQLFTIFFRSPLIPGQYMISQVFYLILRTTKCLICSECFMSWCNDLGTII